MPEPGGVAIRRASPEDIDALVELRLAFERIQRDSPSFDAAARGRALAAMLGPEIVEGSCLAWLAFSGGMAVASGGMSLSSDGAFRGGGGVNAPRTNRARGAGRGRPKIASGEALVHSMFTAREFRRRGIASALLRTIFQEALARGIDRLRLQPTGDSRALYLLFGFVDDPVAVGDMIATPALHSIESAIHRQ